ncbi:MAG: tRNA 2-thiouridine(34) synthase MnmA [Anaerolineae bacterium]|jgi:tRNA-specific 2-thiouridylase
MQHVVVGLSGGVDSSVAALLLAEQGAELSAVMLRLWAEPGVPERDNLCCTPEAVGRARAVADYLGIPFHLIDARERFRQAVVEAFIAEYAAARTPNPCIPCNRDVRFPILLEWVKRLGADRLATGHYSRVRQANGGYQLLRGLDPLKDQSYVLHALGQEHLSRAVFPLGGMTKTDVRDLAAARALPAADQPESQDVCFVADGDYRRFLAEVAPEAAQAGPILDESGRVLGQHSGLVNYTIGQRKGIGVTAPHALYVLALDPERNALIVGPESALGQETCTVARMSYISGRAPCGSFEASAKIRYRHREVAVVATPLSGGRLHVRFAKPQRDVTPGQYLVLYDAEVVIGGGSIVRGSSGT